MEIATITYNINTAEKNETSQFEISSGQCPESKLCKVFLGYIHFSNASSGAYCQ